MMNIDRDYLIHNQICQSIEIAFEFARKYPQTVLTQMYINEGECKVGYELVLLAEIADLNNSRFYKFGVPIIQEKRNNYVKNENVHEQQWHAHYIPTAILTPFMTINNIRLNCVHPGANDNKHVKILFDTMKNHKVSFYKQFDPLWYDRHDNNH